MQLYKYKKNILSAKNAKEELLCNIVNEFLHYSYHKLSLNLNY